MFSLETEFSAERNPATDDTLKKFHFLPRHAVLRFHVLMHSRPPLRRLALHVYGVLHRHQVVAHPPSFPPPSILFTLIAHHRSNAGERICPNLLAMKACRAGHKCTYRRPIRQNGGMCACSGSDHSCRRPSSSSSSSVTSQLALPSPLMLCCRYVCLP